MFEKEITFDRFVRITAIVLGCVLVWLVVKRLSGVLLPFFIAWLFAYLLYPLVCFLQLRCHLRYRILCIVLSMAIALGALAGLLALVLPSTISEASRAVHLIREYMSAELVDTGIVGNAIQTVKTHINEDSIKEIVQQDSFTNVVQGVTSMLWTLVSQVFDIVLGLLQFFLVLLYTFFILLDYERINTGWVKLIPPSKRRIAVEIMTDVKNGMSAYFRGQSLIAFLVGVLFSIGFLIIDFPMAVGLGMFIGLLNMVPYLQIVGFAPTILLAWLKSADTGDNFWGILLAALAVFAVVQTIQDLYLTPRIMSKVMGLKPAIILLSLSVWGSLLGFIGLIIALPLTTLIISYYKRYVLKEMSHAPFNPTEKR